jgi:formyl-CoA transferase
MTETKRVPAGALAGVKVIDLTRILGGPYCTQVLADHGAEVIKVEPPQGDDTRDWGPPFRDGLSAYFAGANRNKRSLGLDVSRAAGRAVLERLLAGADVMVENFKPGTLERWGLGYDEVLAKRFPRLVHCRITGFGEGGPFGGFPGYDAVVQALTGLISINGAAESGPVRLGIPLVDLGTGLYAAIGILMALAERQRSGKGQFLEVTLYDTGVALQHPHAANFFMSNRAPQLTGNAHPNIAPYDLFPTKGRPLFLGVGNDRQFAVLCRELGRPELAEDARFLSNADRVTNRAALTKELAAALAEVDGEAIAIKLLDAGVPAGAALTVPDVMSHPHTRHREMVVEIDGYRGTGIPIKFGRTPGAARRKPPAFNEDGRAILTEAGFAADEIDGLAAQGVLVETRRRL